MTDSASLLDQPLGDQPLAEPPITEEHVAEVAGAVWDSFLGLPLQLSPDSPEPAAGGMSGVVTISGAWRGAVVLQCPSEHAVAAAEAMFAAQPGSLSPAEVADALGELTNMVGGNLKNLLPEPTSLSIPSVSGGGDSQVFVPAARPVLEVPLCSGTALVRVTLWQS